MPPKKKPYSQLSKSAKFYRDNPASRRKKAKVDTKINARSSQKRKRRESGKARRAAKRRGKNVIGLDYDHKQGRFISSKANRGQREKSRLKGSKRKKK